MTCNYHLHICQGIPKAHSVSVCCSVSKKPITPCTASLEQVSYTTTCEVACKFCGSKNVVKNGVRTRGIQYYKCRDCRRAFAGNDALEGMKYSPERIASAISLFYDGLSIDAIRRQIKSLYGVEPSDSTVYEWILRFTKVAVSEAKFSNIKVGSIWIADETVLRLDQDVNAWFWDIIDSKTRFLLASHMSLQRTIKDAQALMGKALERAGKSPRVIYTDKLAAYLDGIELTFGADTTHKRGGPFDIEKNTNLIERFHGTIKARTKVMRGMHNPQTAVLIMDGWLINYNFFRPHEALLDKTPAQVAQADYPYKGWKDVVMANNPKVETCSK